LEDAVGDPNANDQTKANAKDQSKSTDVSTTNAMQGFLSGDPQTYLSMGGLLFLLVALGSLVGMTYFLGTAKVDTFDVNATSDKTTMYAQIVSHYLKPYLSPFMMLIVGILASALGFVMIQMSGRATRLIIHPEDRHLVTDMLKHGNQAGIDDYIRLSSLGGMIGGFTKLGLTGLPLATISLTIIFALLALTPIPDTSKAMLDLCKLTLGAFIGSYVQARVPDRSERQLRTNMQGHSDVTRTPVERP
jgi:hypothetical protein